VKSLISLIKQVIMLIVVAFLKIIFGGDIVVVLCLLDDFLKFLTQVTKTQLNLSSLS